MENIRSAIARLVKAGMLADKMIKQCKITGEDDTYPYEIWGAVLDGIYELIGEHTTTFDKSATYIIMNVRNLSEDRKTDMLFAVYKMNFADTQIPRPHTIERGEMKQMCKEYGGYLHETPEGDWQ